MAKAAPVPVNEKFPTLIRRVSGNNVSGAEHDLLAVEEPLEIRLGYFERGRRTHRAISITMRTVGNDFELASGFLFTEGILHRRDQIESIKHCGKFPNNHNTLRVDLTDAQNPDLKRLERNFYTTSSCGVCGKTSLEALSTGAKPIADRTFPAISADTIHGLPEKVLRGQDVFGATGGLHAAALFDTGGNLTGLCEDVGRHNAVDKLIGGEFLKDSLPLSDKILFLSGRASFELLQKAVMAGIPLVAAVGAPSSLAVRAAEEFGVTLCGFVRDRRFNVYSGIGRIAE